VNNERGEAVRGQAAVSVVRRDVGGDLCGSERWRAAARGEVWTTSPARRGFKLTARARSTRPRPGHSTGR
jgi:hypothetical protein